MSAELCYYNARYYDPELGRFVQADTEADLANPQDLNPYTYVNNNPLNLTDPTGHAVANYGTEQALTRNKQLPLKQDLANYIDGFQVVWSADDPVQEAQAQTSQFEIYRNPISVKSGALEKVKESDEGNKSSGGFWHGVKEFVKGFAEGAIGGFIIGFAVGTLAALAGATLGPSSSRELRSRGRRHSCTALSTEI